MKSYSLEELYLSVKPKSIDSQMTRVDSSYLAYVPVESLLAQFKWCRIYGCTNTKSYKVLRNQLVSLYSEFRIKRLEELF